MRITGLNHGSHFRVLGVCFCIYIYIYIEKLLSGPSLVFYRLLSGPSIGIIWAKLTLACFIVVWSDSCKSQLSFCVFCPILVAPYRVILRYYRAILFQGGYTSPKRVRYPHLVLSFTQTHLCDTPFCNISRNNCAIPHKSKHERVLRYYRCKYRAIWRVSLVGL